MKVNELLVYRTLDAQRAWIFESNAFEKMETLLLRVRLISRFLECQTKGTEELRTGRRTEKNGQGSNKLLCKTVSALSLVTSVDN